MIDVAISGRQNIASIRSLVPRREHMWLAVLILSAGVAHGVNMLHFPYVESDEGTYASQGWAIISTGHLAAYTYWYDHAPFGWMQIALWYLITGGTHSFGDGIASGRILMLLVQCASAFLLYGIVRSVTGWVWPATLALLCFSLSSFGIYFHRRILLDNFASLWMLLSIYALVTGRLSLKRVWLSAAALALSVLSKEVTAFLIPPLLLLVAHLAPRDIRWFALSGWLILSLSITSLYPLMALLNGEFFPVGSALGGTHPHVSLLCTLQYQAARGRDGGILNPHSLFWIVAGTWWHDEPLLLGGGLAGAALCVASFWLDRTAALLGLCTLALFAFVARGGLVIQFYLVPLLAPLATSLSLFTWLLVEVLRGARPGKGRRFVAASAIGTIFVTAGVGIAQGYERSDLGLGNDHAALWDARQADAQQEAASWVDHNVPPGSRMEIDQSMWMAFHDPLRNEHIYPRAHYYWKVEADPEINQNVFHSDWRNVDYVITTIQLLSDTRRSNLTLTDAAVKHSNLLERFDTGGWPVEVRKVDATISNSGPPAITPGVSQTSDTGAGTPPCSERP